jgi:hypothetical protein
VSGSKGSWGSVGRWVAMWKSTIDVEHWHNMVCACGQHAFQHTEWRVKAIPLQALTGPEGSRTLRLPDFKTIGT